MEKRAVVDSRVTKDTEGKLPPKEKQADVKTRTERLDDDFTKRAADKAAEKLKKP